MQKSEFNQVGFDEALVRLNKKQRQSMRLSGCSMGIDPRWEKTEYYCPCCGAHAMFKPTDDCGGDYYAGSTYLCSQCKATSHLDSAKKHDTTEREV